MEPFVEYAKPNSNKNIKNLFIKIYSNNQSILLGTACIKFTVKYDNLLNLWMWFYLTILLFTNFTLFADPCSAPLLGA